MINQQIEHRQRTHAWVLSPGSLIDRLLDHIERLGNFILPARVDTPSYREAEIEVRLDRFGA
jgi:hypothetical protein